MWVSWDWEIAIYGESESEFTQLGYRGISKSVPYCFVYRLK
jgi:hypothetical protein